MRLSAIERHRAPIECARVGCASLLVRPEGFQPDSDRRAFAHLHGFRRGDNPAGSRRIVVELYGKPVDREHVIRSRRQTIDFKRPANVNCRIFPGHSPEEIRQQLIGIFGDPKLTVKYVSDAGVVSDTAPERKAMVPPAPIKEVFEPLTRLTQAIWPGTPVTPVMENGASDSIYFAQAGIPCYGYSAIALERDDDRAHGQDERLPVDSYWKSLDFFYSFARAVGDE